jgi:signal transduction histidine kinase/DNA-binding response OmpR family regulator
MDNGTAGRSESPHFLAGGGEMGARMRAFDWEQTPLGPAAKWPQSLKTIVRVILDSRYAMWMLWGTDLTFFCNDAYLPTVGIKRDWVLGARADKVWEEIWPDIGPRITQVLEHGQATWDEGLLLFLERSGFPEETYHTFSYSPVYDDRNRISGMLCVVTEVTDRVIGERRLGVLRDLATRDAGVETVEQACERPMQVLAHNPLDLPFACLYLLDEARGCARLAASTPALPAPYRAAVIARETPVWPILSVAESRQARTVTLQPAIQPPTPPQWPEQPVVQALILPIFGQSATGVAAVLVAGISPRRVLDDGYRGFLDLVAKQFSAAIAGAQAYQSERRRAEALAEIDRGKTAFFSNVSHEFRTPLTLMLGPIEEALSDPATPQGVRSRLRLAHRNSLRLLKLVNSLLDFSRIEAGRVEASYEPTDLAALTSDLASTFRSALERAGLSFAVDCESLGEPVYVDREMWEKIVLNLLSNAFKFTFNGRIGVHLRRQGDQAVLEVADTGVGIPDHELPRLFERFHRVEGTRGRSQEGSGIGLALVQELVRLHGGQIDVDSGPGRGSVFRVQIPLGSAHLPADRIRASRDLNSTASGAEAYAREAMRWSSESTGDTSLGLPILHEFQQPPTESRFAATAGARILLADDNADMRAYVRDLLRPYYVVEAVADGEEALAAARRETPDLIVSDVMMPRLDGFALLQRLHSDETLRLVPVILLSARAGEESTIEGLDEGADDYLAKPFAARELLARVAGQLSLTKLRRDAQAAVIESEHRFRVALGASAAGFTLLQAVRGADGHIEDFEWRYVNDSAERIIGVPAAALLGKRVFQILPQNWDSSPGLLRLFKEVIDGGSSRDIELPVTRAAERRWIHSNVAKLGDGLVVWFADVTDRKRVEAELRDADRRKDEFLAVLAHELRNPLAPIRQAAQLAASPRSTDAQLRWSGGVIERQVRQMARLLDDLLDVSRITRGRLELRRERLDVKSVVEAAAETARPVIEQRRHTLRLHLPASLPPVDADPMRLAQVISNLLTNAAKYTDPEGTIDLGVEVLEGWMLIRVRDNGIGIEPAAIANLFQMFSQLRPALERSEGGLGIGLSLVKGLIALHGGSVEAHSGGVGRGSEFIVRLPLAAQQLSTQEGGDARPQAGGLARRILVVDDNRDATETLAALLAADGHQVKTAFDGEEALSVARTFEPDVAVIDIGLPKKNGYDVARELRQLQSSEPLTLVALTGWGQAEDKTRSRSAGFDEHLTKPVDYEAVRAIANRAARRGNTTRSSRSAD